VTTKKLGFLAALAGLGFVLTTGAVRAQSPNTAGDVSPGDAGSVQRGPAIAATAARSGAGPRGLGRARSIEVSASVVWMAPASLGSSTARMVTNDASGSPYLYFTASADLQSAAGLETRFTYNLTRMFAVEGGLTYSRPGVSFTIANDVEGVPGFTATGESISQFFLDVNAIAYIPGATLAGGKVRMFAEGGVGYLRQLHGQTGPMAGYLTAETGQVYHVGGGLKYFFRVRPKGLVKGLGVRVDGRLYIMNGGFSFDGRKPKTAALGAGIVAAF
jgi:hypothetical protein